MLATIAGMKTPKPGLEAMIEARLQATDNWPQPPWVLAALTQELETEVQELVNRKIDSDSVRKIYRRKPTGMATPPKPSATPSESSRSRLNAA